MIYEQSARWGGRGGGRGGRGGGRGGRGGRGQAGTGRGGSFGRAGGFSSSRGGRGSSRGHLGKGVYSTTTYGTHGRPGSAGSYNTSTIRGSRGQVLSVSRAYGLARADGGFGQVGTGRGSFMIGGKRGNFGRSGGRRFGGGGVSRQAAAVAPPSGGDDGGGDDGGTTPTPTPGRERSVRVRNSPARRTALRRGRRGDASRRSARVQLGGLSGGGSTRSGVNV